MVDPVTSPGRLEIFQTLREGVRLLPKATGPLLLAYLIALGLMVMLSLPLSVPFAILRVVLEVGGLGASGPGARVAEALPHVMSIVGWMIQAYVAVRLVVAQYRIAAEVRAGLRPRSLEVFCRPDPPLLPLVSLILALGLGALMGSSALVIPGVLFLLVFGQALPAMIFEGTNIKHSLAASRRLTRGNLPSLLGLTLILLPLAFVPSLLSYLVAKAAGPDVSLIIVLPTLAVVLFLLLLLSCLWALVAAIVYQDLRAQIADPLPNGQPEIDGVPA